MNIFQKIKALFEVRSVGTEIIQEASMPTASGKPGWQTTEFWGKVGVQVMTLWGAVSGFIPPKYALVIGTSLEAVYAVCRTVSKAVADVQAAKTASAIAGIGGDGDTATANVTVKAS